MVERACSVSPVRPSVVPSQSVSSISNLQFFRWGHPCPLDAFLVMHIFKGTFSHLAAQNKMVTLYKLKIVMFLSQYTILTLNIGTR